MSTPSTLTVVESVLDEGRLSALVGRTVRAARLRVKPDVSLTVGLEHPGTGRPVGWARLLWPVSRVKAETPPGAPDATAAAPSSTRSATG